MKGIALLAVLFCSIQLGYAQLNGSIDESALEVIYVSPVGNDNNTGSSPITAYRSIKKALGVASTKKRAGLGVKIEIAPGVYREGSPNDNWVLTFNFQLAQSTSAPLVIQGAGWDKTNPKNTGDVIISGSEDWSGGWTKNADGTWSKDWPYAFGVPSKTVSFGVSDAFLRRELVHVNGQTYYHINPPNYTNLNGTVGGAAEGDPGNPNNVNGGRATASEGLFWVKDAVLSNGSVVSMGKITIKPPSNSPADYDLNAAGTLVEVSTKRNLMQIWLGAQSSAPTNIILRNLTFQHAGGPYPLLVQHQNNLLIEDCRFIKNKKTGLGITPGQNVTLRRVECSENGESGAGISTASHCLLEACKFNRNSRQGEIVGYTGWSVCGVKFYSPIAGNHRIKMWRCEALDNRSGGFWWDTGNLECEMVECVAMRNSTNGTFIEDNNSTENNYENPGTGTKGINGIPNLGNRPTVTALRCIFANNRPAAGTEGYRTNKGRGIFFSENENAVIDGCLIYNNDIQISTYDNSRAENRNFIFRNNLIAAQNTNQRLYAVGSNWDSGLTITAKNSNGAVIGTFKGAWFALFDGLSGSTNDNRYYHPLPRAFYSRNQRWGTDKWVSQVQNTVPELSLQDWQKAHLNNANNSFTDKSVDSRSLLVNSLYDESTKPLVSILPDTNSLLESAKIPGTFTVHRVSSSGYSKPLTVEYTVRTQNGDAQNGIDFETLSGQLTIPAGARSATITIVPYLDKLTEDKESVSILLREDASNYVVAKPLAQLELIDATVTSNAQVASEEAQILVFPNPFRQGDLTIQAKKSFGNEKLKLSIRDISGKLVYQTNAPFKTKDSSIQVNRGLFVTGMYIVKISTPRGLIFEQKLVVQ